MCNRLNNRIAIMRNPEYNEQMYCGFTYHICFLQLIMQRIKIDCIYTLIFLALCLIVMG